MNRIAKLLAVLALLSAPICTLGADIPIFPTGPVYKLPSNPVWGVSGPTGFNNNFFFTPLSQNGSVCVYVKNNNTTNPHTFTASIVVTSDPNNITPSDGTWQVAASSSGILSATSPGLPGGIGVNVSGVSQVSINFSASSTQAGSPETASVTISQTQGNCFAGNQFIGSAPQTTASVTPLQAISDGLSQAFEQQFSATNPTTGVILLNINSSSGKNSLYFNQLQVSCTATCQLVIATSTSLGTTCGGLTPVNKKIGSSVTSSSVSQNNCAGAPTGTTFYNGLAIGAGNNVTLDLRGFIGPAGAVTGIQIQAVAFTGTVAGFMDWYEK